MYLYLIRTREADLAVRRIMLNFAIEMLGVISTISRRGVRHRGAAA